MNKKIIKKKHFSFSRIVNRVLLYIVKLKKNIIIIKRIKIFTHTHTHTHTDTGGKIEFLKSKDTPLYIKQVDCL